MVTLRVRDMLFRKEAHMARKKKVTAAVISQKQIGEQIFDLWLETKLVKDVHPGQFVAVYPHGESTLLPRPISVCEADQERGSLRLVYRVAGKGTAEFSACRAGDTLDILGVLGNGFPVEKAKGKKVFLMGGGIGIPPLLELAKGLDAKKQILLGYRNRELFLEEDLAKYGDVYVATEDGSVGTKGNVMDIISAYALRSDVIMACGPMPMLRAVKAYAQKEGIRAYLSLEERMACGVGACLGCVCKTTGVDAHSHVHNARICTEGPVFEAGEVVI